MAQAARQDEPRVEEECWEHALRKAARKYRLGGSGLSARACRNTCRTTTPSLSILAKRRPYKT